MPAYISHIPLCTGCGIPMDEMPDSEGEWMVYTKIIPCTASDQYCPGHIRECRIYCKRCQAEGKDNEVPTHPNS